MRSASISICTPSITGGSSFLSKRCCFSRRPGKTPRFGKHDSRARPVAGAGVVLTLAQSTLWLGPPAWVYVVAGLGGVAQLVGFGIFLRVIAARGAEAAVFTSAIPTTARWLLRLALAAWGLKLVLQAAAVAPGLDALANHRFIVIAFLHLVFLGVVAPAILALGFLAGWLRDTSAARFAVGVFFVAAAVSEAVLVALALGWESPVSLPWLLFAPTAFMAASTPFFFVVGASSHASVHPRLSP
jgi:hypothetical protein